MNRPAHPFTPRAVYLPPCEDPRSMGAALRHLRNLGTLAELAALALFVAAVLAFAAP